VEVTGVTTDYLIAITPVKSFILQAHGVSLKNCFVLLQNKLERLSLDNIFKGQ
jgi:hypothetical protein